jgi:putative membrane protein
MKSRPLLRLTLALVGLFAAGAQAAPTDRSAETNASAKFIQRALATDEKEMQTAERAAACASDAQTKRVAKILAREHALTYEQLSSLAQRKNWTVDTVSSMASVADTTVALLATQNSGAASAENFDEQFIDEQIRGHQQSIALFRDQAENGDDADVKAFARNTLPKLEERLSKLRGLRP